MGEVCSVQGEQERDQDCSLWGPCTADNYVQHTVLRPLRLWLVGGVGLMKPFFTMQRRPLSLCTVPVTTMSNQVSLL